MNHVADCESNNRLHNDISEKLQDYMKVLQFFDDDIENYHYIYDLETEYIYFTNKIYKRLPLPFVEENRVKYSDWIRILYPKDREFVDKNKRQLIAGEIKSFNIAYRILDYEGNYIWINVKGTMRENVNGHTKLLVGHISEMVVGRIVDGLTGLCSKEKFMEDFKECLQMDDGYLMVFGIDNFKNINITQGRAVGDRILKQIALVLDQHTNYSDKIYRLDGDCFAAIFPNKQRQEIVDFYNCLKREMKKICTISAGAVSYEKNCITDSGLIYQYAENALDQAKKDGKNVLEFFSENNYQKDLEQIELLDEIETSVKQGYQGFSLCYQPQINSTTFEISSVEVLLRFNSLRQGNISPMKFIPLLEENGLICPVGEWVLKTALLQCKEWRKTIPNLRVSVNLSHVQLQQEEFAETVLALLKAADLPGEALVLEVTESIQLQDYIYLNKIFYAWKQNGIRIAIDDFGTGYSSLSYLKSIEIDEIKIDRCFVDHVQCNAYNHRLLKNMIELAHSVKITVCCEGVETFEEFLALQELHTDLYQGYLFAKPYTKENFEQAYIVSQSKIYQDRKSKESYFQQVKPCDYKELLEDFRKEEIGNITESMEELVYISDIDTYELYYLNAVGRQLTGFHDYKGRKCYQVLHGKNAPCEFCTNNQLCENKFHVWENSNLFLKKKYILKDKLIRWQGKIVRLEMAIDITERELVSKAIQKRLDFEQSIVDSCRILASENSYEKIARNVVSGIGKFCQGSRAYILKWDSGSNICELNSEWYAKGVKSINEHFPMVIKEPLEEDSNKRVSAQIKRGNRVIGLLGVDNPRHKEDGYNLVKTMAYFLGYSMIGEDNQQKLNHLIESRYVDIRNHTDLGLWEIRMNPEKGDYNLYPDKILCRIMGIEKSMSPKDNYNHWYNRIKDGYYDYVDQAVDKMIQTRDTVHLEYPWNFPSKGEVIVHCVGARREDCEGMICLEGYHWIVSK